MAGVAAGDPKIAVNTHHHPDHTYGNGFLPPSTTIIGHHLCREGVLRAPASRRPTSCPPTTATWSSGRPT